MRRFIAAIVAVILLLTFPAYAAESTGEDTAATIPVNEKIVEVLNFLTKYGLNYDGESAEELIAKAALEYLKNHPEELEEFLNTLMQQQDKYSYYMEPVTYDNAFSGSETFVGIGVSLDSERPNSCMITGIFVDSPAEKAGLLAGDIIVSIDGKNVEGAHYSELSSLIRGEEGTDVTIDIMRDGKLLSFTMTRSVITVSDIDFRDLGGGIAYIRIARFTDIRTFIDFINAFARVYNEGFRSVVYDLRDNLGGSVEVLYNILHYAVSTEGAELFSIAARDGIKKPEYSAAYAPAVESAVVLVNGNTASAAEMFAGALKYSEDAVLIGTTTYGKGVGQYHLTMDDDSVAVITNFEIFLPGGIAYNEVGITPDFEVPNRVVSFPEYTALSPLGSSDITRGSSGFQVLALEQRLSALGYFDGSADTTFDDATLEAVNEFQAAHDLAVTNRASRTTLETLDSYFKEYSGLNVMFDDQLTAAINYLAPLSHMPRGCDGVTVY